jgi:integral membrane protein
VTIDQTHLRRLRVLGMIEGTSTLVLFGIAMPLKYLGGMPMAVTIVGSVHGLLFLALVFAFVTSVRRVPLPPRLAAAGVFCAVIPFGPFLLDARLKRVGQAG